MSAWLARLAPVITCLLMLGALWMQRGTIVAYQEAIAGYKEIAGQANESARLAAEVAVRVAEKTIILQKQQNNLRAALSVREIELGALQNDVAEIRDWAGAFLPTDIARLRARPPISGVDQYNQYVSGRGALHPAGRKPENERGSESGAGAR